MPERRRQDAVAAITPLGRRLPTGPEPRLPKSTSGAGCRRRLQSGARAGASQRERLAGPLVGGPPSTRPPIALHLLLIGTGPPRRRRNRRKQRNPRATRARAPAHLWGLARRDLIALAMNGSCWTRVCRDRHSSRATPGRQPSAEVVQGRSFSSRSPPRYVFRGPAMGPLASGPGMTVSPLSNR